MAEPKISLLVLSDDAFAAAAKSSWWSGFFLGLRVGALFGAIASVALAAGVGLLRG